jgi:hypothetical protein
MAAQSERDLGVIQFEAYAVMFEERLNRPAASAFFTEARFDHTGVQREFPVARLGPHRFTPVWL